MPATDNIPNSDPKTVNAIKEYIAPILLGIVGVFVWSTLAELRSDVKLILIQQSADKVRMEIVEADVALLKSVAYNSRQNASDRENNKNYSHTQPAKKEDELQLN